MAISYLVASLGLLFNGQGPDNRPSNLNHAVDWVLILRPVPGSDAPAVRAALIHAAYNDKVLYNAVFFAGQACTLAEARTPYGDFATFMERTNVAWDGLSDLGDRYVVDGSFPAVRYEIGKNRENDWLKSIDDKYKASPYLFYLQSLYAGLRQLGIKPDAAWQRVTEGSENAATKDGVAEIRSELEALGKWALTGYSASDAERDTLAFLEALYAFRNPKAPDIKAVAPAASPMIFIGNKMILAMRADVGHMLLPADKVIEAVEAQLAAARQSTPSPPAAPPVSAPERRTLFPNSDWVKAPGLNKPPEPYGWVVDTLAIEGYGLGFFDTGAVDATADSPSFQLVKYLATEPIAPGRHRGGYRDFTGYHLITGFVPLKPNSYYDLIAFPWYWAPTSNDAFFMQGTMNGNAWEEIQNPPASGRLNLPASPGQVFEVQLRVRTDAFGRFRLLFAQPDAGAISLGIWYIKPVTP